MNRLILVSVALGGLILAQGAGAHGIDDRRDRQASRIEHGVKSGQLTRWETRSLLREQRRIGHLERRFLRDDRLDRYERRVLRAHLDRASRRIAWAKHNDHHRFGRDDRHRDHDRFGRDDDGHRGDRRRDRDGLGRHDSGRRADHRRDRERDRHDWARR